MKTGAIQGALEEPLGYDDVAPDLRPVDARLRNDTFVLRVRRVEVLHREPWSALED